MSKIELNYLIIEYENDDECYIKDFVKNLEKETKRIVNFFDIKEFNNKVNIKIWNNLENFRYFAKINGFTDKNGNVNNWVCGIAKDNNINVLTLKEYKKTKYHENGNLNDIFYLILHEFVHTCYNKVVGKNKRFKWLSEGVATTISGQYNKDLAELEFNTTIEDMEEGTVHYNNYYIMFSYVYKTYGKDYIMALIRNYNLQEQDTSRLFEETKEYMRNLHNNKRK